MDFESLVDSYTFDGKLNQFYSQEKDNIPRVFQEFFAKPRSSSDFAIACTIVQDLRINSDLSRKEKGKYLKSLIDGKFFANLSGIFSTGTLSARASAIATMGKIGVRSNTKYLENAFLDYFYLKNPILASRSIFEIGWLRSRRHRKLLDMIVKRKDTINLISLGILFSSQADNQFEFERLRKQYSEILNIGDLDSHFSLYEIMVFNIQNALESPDWDRETYLRSYAFYNEICILEDNEQKKDHYEISKRWKDFLLTS